MTSVPVRTVPPVGCSGESKSGRFCNCFWKARISCSGVSLWTALAMLAWDLERRLLDCRSVENLEAGRDHGHIGSRSQPRVKVIVGLADADLAQAGGTP